MGREPSFGRRDTALIDLLVDLGLPKGAAKALVALRKRNETTSLEVERITGLRQPEVSLAIRELRLREWVGTRRMPAAGKGRSVHVYSLAKEWPVIIVQLDRVGQLEVERIQESRRRLRSFAGDERPPRG